MTEHTDHLEIVVRGSARGRYRPERGIIHLAVRVEGADKSAVYTRAVEVHADSCTTIVSGRPNASRSRLRSVWWWNGLPPAQ